MDTNFSNPHGLSRGQAFLKRTFDLLVSLAGIMLLSWLIVIALIAATIDTRRWGLFTQERVGRGGRLFRIAKIRTMRSTQTIQTTVTTSYDARITSLGRILRRTKIDELPQLFNILVGHMSFVGPRPDVSEFTDTISEEDRIILAVRPGVTGPATLKYRDEEHLLGEQEDPEEYNRSVVFPDKIRINKAYVQNYSFTGDLRYLYRTIMG